MENAFLTAMYAHAQQNKIPFAGSFELTPMCNMDCKMCYVRKTPAQVEQGGGLLPVEGWLDIARQAKETGTFVLIITGGEPLTYPGFKPLYEKLQRMGFLISLNTNGTLLDDEFIEWLSARQPDKINITLYSASDETYKALCGKSDGFTVVSENIKKLLRNGFNVYLNCVATKYNAHDIPAMHAFAKSLGLTLHLSTYMFPPVRKNEKNCGNPARLSAPDAAGISVDYEKLMHEGENFAERAMGLLEYDPCDIPESERRGEPLPCRAGKCSYWISWQGKMTPCGLMNTPSEDLKETDFLTAWEKIKTETAKFTLPKECTGCRYRKLCYICGAAAIAETGKSDTVPEYVCALAKNTADILKNNL